jgi:sulfate transport system ATP-binding protein
MISVEGVTKKFGSFQALNTVSLQVPEGQLLALLGPSGSGKTTLLRILAGLDQPDTGAIHLDGIDATGLKAKDRRVGFVFQHYALFRHMTVADNVAFGLKVRKGPHRPPRGEIAERVGRLLDLVQLAGLAGRYPSQLSGGQRQRVALARALAVEPRLLLLDEPFGALDAQVRKDLRRWLRRLHDEMGLTSVFVTHDQEEALELADEVVVMHKGRIEQVGSPAEIYDHPATPFVYRFLGNVNVLPAQVRAGVAQLAGLTFEAPGLSGEVEAFIRPHDIELSAPEEGQVRAVVRHLMVIGATVRLEMWLNDEISLEAELTRERWDSLGVPVGATVGLSARRARLFGSP